MNTNKTFRKIAIALAVMSLWAAQLACDNGGTDIIRDANNSCNDITSCVMETPKEIQKLCQVAGGYHDASGTCVMP